LHIKKESSLSKVDDTNIIERHCSSISGIFGGSIYYSHVRHLQLSFEYMFIKQ